MRMRKISDLSYFWAMRQRFLDFIKKHALIEPNDKVLLAVSGGVDSMVLLHLFSTTTFPAHVAHCNFQLRGEAAEGDENFVRQVAESLNIPCHTQRFDTQSHAENEGNSIQMAARNLRYEWFAELCQQNGIQKLATAHHLDDSIETVLHNLTRGTSIAGLRGIKAKQQQLVRPLLPFTKAEILAYAKEHELTWREDASNAETYYKRNFIRHELVPRFEQLNPAFQQTLGEQLAKLQEVEAIFETEVGSLREKYLKASEGHWLLKKELLLKIGPHVLEKVLSPFGLRYDQAKQLVGGQSLSGKRFLMPEHELVVDRDYLVITAMSQKEAITYDQIDEQLEGIKRIGDRTYQMAILERNHLTEIPRQSSEAYLDADRLEFPLLVRPWQQGDSFQPLGMQGKKKISDLMIDHKIPVNLKSKVHVIVSGTDIVWVVGLRIDERYKVTAATRRILSLRQTEGNV